MDGSKGGGFRNFGQTALLDMAWRCMADNGQTIDSIVLYGRIIILLSTGSGIEKIHYQT